MLLVFFLLRVPAQPDTKLSPREKLRQANLLGFICLVPGIVCICLVLQYGGTTYSVCLYLLSSSSRPATDSEIVVERWAHYCLVHNWLCIIDRLRLGPSLVARSGYSATTRVPAA